MSRLPSYVPLCISMLLVVATSLAQLPPVIIGVQDFLPLSCDDEVPAPDYANVLVDPQCSTATLTVMDRDLCQDYNVYEVQTPLFDESFEQDNWALWLGSNIDLSSPHFYWQSERSRMFVSEHDAFLLGYASNAQSPNKVFEVYVELVNGVDYEGWNSQLTVGNPATNRSYRDNYGLANISGEELWNTWSYYETDGEASYMTGENVLLGTSGSISHAPTNHLFGFQIGVAANNHNENFGFTTWALISGQLQGDPWSAQCDIDGDAVLLGTVGELYCADVILRTWTATDNCGRVSRTSQLILTEGGAYPSDFNGDGSTDVLDFINFNSAFGTNCADCPEDLNADRVVDIHDFLLWNSLFGSQCD